MSPFHTSFTGKSILSLYLSYEKSTKYALDWLFANSNPQQASDTTDGRLRSTKDIVDAARNIHKQGLTVPDSVIASFYQGIQKRHLVHHIYSQQHATEKDGEADLRHRTFIHRLEEALRILLPLAAASKPTSEVAANVPNSATSISHLNRYALLSRLQDEEGSEERFDTNAIDNDISEHILRDQPQDEVVLLDNNPILVDDELGHYIKLSFMIYELDAICGKVNDYWTQVAEKKLPILVAGVLTTTALYAVQRITKANSKYIPDHESIIRQWFSGKDYRIRFTEVPEFNSTYKRFSENTGLWSPWRLINDCRTLPEYNHILPSAGSRENPIKEISKATDDYSYSDNMAMDKMQESMRQLLNSRRAIASFESKQKSEHLLDDLDIVLKNKDVPIPTHLVFGMEMLLSTYKAFLWPSGRPNQANCRIAALQFASQVLRSLNGCLSCLEDIESSKDSKIVLHSLLLTVFQSWLEDYVREQRFDLYYQASWIAAGHMIEILHYATYDGFNLCCQSNYVAAVLHFYNAFHHVNPKMGRVLWLDQLCRVFTKALFFGSLPSRNFSSIFRRSIGGRLSRNSGIDRTGKGGRSYTIDRTYTKLDRKNISISTLSLFYLLHNNNYATTEDFWFKVYTGRLGEDATQSDKRQVTTQMNSTIFTVPLDRIKEALLPEFEGDMPVATIDFFSVFCICANILKELCVCLDSCLETSCEEVTSSAAFGVDIVDSLLEKFVNDLDDRFLSSLLPSLQVVKKSSELLSSMDAQKTLKRFSWTF